MHTTFNLISIALPKIFSRTQIEILLDCTFKKSIEKTFYAEFEQAYIVYTQFNVLTFINYPKEEIIKALTNLEIKNADTFEQHMIFQDYPIVIDASLPFTCKVNNEHIILKEASALLLVIIALVVSQSVGLEKYEQNLEKHFIHSKRLLNATHSYSPLNRSKLTTFAKKLTLIQYDMVSDLFLLDKPNILWDNEDAENLYNLLAAILELKDRFEIVEYKLTGLKDDIDMVLDLSNHKQSELLDWIIIILIAIAIAIALLDFIVH